MGQGGKGWRRCQACRSEPPKARGRHRSFEISLSLSLSLPVSVFRPPFSSLLALARAVSVTPRSLFVPSFRAAFSVGPSLVSLSVNLRTGWWDGRDGRGGREGRREVRLGGQRVPVHGTRSVLVALIGGSFVPMFETGFRTPRLCIRRKYGFVRTRGARGCMNPSPPPLRPATHPPPPHCCCCSCVGSRSRYPAAPPHSERYPSNTFEPPYRISECLAAIYPPIPVAMYSPPSPL